LNRAQREITFIRNTQRQRRKLWNTPWNEAISLAMLYMMRQRNITELIGVAVSIIGLVMGLAAVKAGASLFVILGIALIVIGLAIVNRGGK
jgi:sulfite exporter TauE/SafE